MGGKWKSNLIPHFGSSLRVKVNHLVSVACIILNMTKLKMVRKNKQPNLIDDHSKYYLNLDKSNSF